MNERFKKLLFPILSILFGVLVSAIALELLAITYLSLRDGEYISGQERFQRSMNKFILETTTGNQCRYTDGLLPHPYLAFVHHSNPPCGNPEINNIGLFGNDFTFEKRRDRFVVMVTGGSVAAQFAQINKLGPKYLENILNENYTSPNGKPFLVLNGGDGAWKQPQQLILFLLYLNTLDAVITLDGFNEHYNLKGTGYRFEYPANNFFEVSPLASQSFGILFSRWLFGNMVKSLSQSLIFSRSQAAYYILYRINKTLNLDRTPGGARKTTKDLFRLPADWSKEKSKIWGIDQYKKYIRAMSIISKSNDILSAHFIQPVPAIMKNLTPEEISKTGDLSYRNIYRDMTGKLMELKEDGINIFSLLDLFINDNISVYSDAIHLIRNKKGESYGYNKMAKKIAIILEKTWNLKRKE